MGCMVSICLNLVTCHLTTGGLSCAPVRFPILPSNSKQILKVERGNVFNGFTVARFVEIHHGGNSILYALKMEGQWS